MYITHTSCWPTCRTIYVNKVACDEMWHMNWRWHMQHATWVFPYPAPPAPVVPVANTVSTVILVLNCQQLRFYCAKMHLCIFLMAQFRTKINDIRKNNIACDCELSLPGSLSNKTNNCGNCRITVVDSPRHRLDILLSSLLPATVIQFSLLNRATLPKY